MRTWIMLLSLVLGAPGTVRAAPTTEPAIDLVTMGQGPLIWHRFGHAAMCVIYRRTPTRSLCYNYGTADFDSPPQRLGWRFLRGTARFWVSTQSYPYLKEVYRDYDRSLWAQRLPLTQRQVDQLVARLRYDMKPAHRYYTYHHFDNNCSTRLRDHIDAVLHGAFRRGSQRKLGITLRDMGRRGLADQTGLIMLATLTLGRRLDRKVTVWEAMFHPDYLRAEVARQLGARPVQIYKRKGPPLPHKGSQGHGWFLLVAVLLSLPVVISRLWGRFERLAVAFAAVPLTLIAALIYFIAIVTTVSEMRVNEALLVFWPTDILLVILGSRRRRIYATVRLVWLLLFLLLWLAGVFLQPLAAAVMMPALPCAVLLWRGRRREVHPAPAPDPPVPASDPPTPPARNAGPGPPP